ncbi:hypothetical protein IQ244_07410 [Nostoc sp. LEGE 06077]|nr:hypothetical protein [Nostoc sp. LEGE 06077]MBE9206341.1 hypothetical protein [Nostoc sp. LEGE 06077]
MGCVRNGDRSQVFQARRAIAFDVFTSKIEISIFEAETIKNRNLDTVKSG